LSAAETGRFFGYPPCQSTRFILTVQVSELGRKKLYKWKNAAKVLLFFDISKQNNTKAPDPRSFLDLRPLSFDFLTERLSAKMYILFSDRLYTI
jgi:hypothetical protein